MVTSGDSGVFVDSQVIGIRQSDSFKAVDLQSSTGDMELSQQDSVTGSDFGYSSIMVNPMSQIGYISLNIYPVYEISLDIIAHT
jgi:hypothetical protein